jgi:hypothetical protein
MIPRLLPALLLCLAAALPAGAQILLLNPGTATGNSTLAGTVPYAPAGYDTWRWNNGAGTYTSPVYANGNPASVTVTVDGGTIATAGGGTTASGSADFASPGQISGNAGAETTDLFNTSLAAKGGIVTNTGGTPYATLIGMRISGLSLGLYDVYLAAAYVGDNTDDARPGGANPTAQVAFAFAGNASNTLTYSSSAGSATVTGAGSHSAFQTISNENNDDWVLGANYARFTVELTLTSPTLYLLTTGDGLPHNDVLGNTGERRAWMNLIQIIPVPEPGAFTLLACAALTLLTRRRSV